MSQFPGSFGQSQPFPMDYEQRLDVLVPENVPAG